VRTTEDLVELLDPPGSCFYHYTRLDTAVAHILPTGRMKMNPFAEMRDPRESKELNPVASGPASLEATRRFAKLHADSRQVKRRVKVLCLTRDDPRNPDGEDAIFGRGFAHPRLWEQYADNHRGICLCFDREKLVRLLSVEVRGRREPLFHGPVVYRDGRVSLEEYTFPASDFDGATRTRRSSRGSSSRTGPSSSSRR
jgi:hypothetical protein